MRIIILLFIALSASIAKAQTVVPSGIASYAPGGRLLNNLPAGDSVVKNKWSFNRYGALSTSFSFFKGGNATIISAPMGLQVNRMLTNNLYAFANVTAAPAYVNFNGAFTNTGANKTYPGNSFYGRNSTGIYTAASIGLGYINNDKTFSISGSISVEKSSNAMLPLYPNYIIAPVPYSRTQRY